ncbi:DUF808 domain-containing protein [Bizionia argentinensis JUB59]|uniref:DUF808 domain-containing protein n=1 Tax=Bizionia argentinensis JUB59 TaxID=1046627 RepID=G2EAU8_9FLAO|nr:DUF808 family protein [Bizionia argentinensis]EGV44314.1 DUF808 domain-containing protein [Bizionia argentinensis JUB59]
MASGFFALLDDIGVLMDDVAVLSKVTTKKTAGILGDDLAVNAEKASGFMSSREIPVLWAITKGSFLNKLIILPIAFLLSAFLPAAVTIILILGGIYLAFEGAEKIVDYFIPHGSKTAAVNTAEELSEKEILEQEKSKIKSAILTDFILSVEIVIIALGVVLEQTLLLQIIVVSIVAIIATVGVYGIVALIVRMDDFGLKLVERSGGKGVLGGIGTVLVNALPYVIKSLSVIGTIALILVSGGIFAHNIDFFHHVFEAWPSILKEFTIGLIIGILAVLVFKFVLWVVGMVRG